MVASPTRIPGILRGRAAGRVLLAGALGLVLAGPAAAGAAAAGPEAPAGPIQISLAARVQATRPDVSLGEVAAVGGSDPAAVARVAALRLGALPGDGSPVRLDRGALQRWIRARTGLDGAAIVWSGAAVTEVRLSIREIGAEALVEAAVAAVRDAAARRGLRPEIRVARAPRPARVPAGDAVLSARPIGPEALKARRVVVWVEVSANGKVARAVPVSLDVSTFGPGYVAARQLAAGQALDATALAVREVEWTGRDVLPVRETALGELRLLRPMGDGDVLTRSHAEPLPLVRRGARATLRQTLGHIALESAVEVLEDGRGGQPVRVRVATSSAPILARVTGPDRVEVVP